MKKVFIYSKEVETATGIDQWTNDTSGRRLKKTKIGRTRDTIQALFSSRYAGLANGLSYKPWIVDGQQQKDSQTGKGLTLQDKMEQKWGLDKGYLTNRPWRRGDSPNEEDMTYFQRQGWKLNDGSTILDLNNFDDEMFYYVCLDSKFVANSETELKQGKWPYATHYIALENEAEELKFQKNKLKSQAFARLHHKDMIDSMKKKFIYILGLANTKAEVNVEQAHNTLFDYIDKSSFKPGSNIDKFNELFKLLKTAPGREEIEARLSLKKAMDSRVIYERQGAYKWARANGVITLGETYAEAVEFMLNPKKEALVEELTNEIKTKGLI